MEEKKKSGFATAGLVLGIIGVCTSFIPIVNNLSFILGLIGILFGIVSLIKKASKKTAIAAIIVCVLAMYFTVSSQKSLSDSIDDAFNEVSNSLDTMTGENTEDVLKNDLDVELGKFKVEEGEYGINETKLNVKVTNKKDEKVSGDIQVEAVDKDGNRIMNDYVYFNDLGAGQSQSFDIFTYIPEEDLSKVKKAEFKIVSASIY